MADRSLFYLVLLGLGVSQFLVVPFFSNQSFGGKLLFFSLFVIGLCLRILLRKEWSLPILLVPLIGLSIVFSLSLFFSSIPQLGFVELGTFILGVVFCFLIANLKCEREDLQKWVFIWFQAVGFIIALLCIYQYADWLLYGQKTTTLIPYLLPPGSHRVNGVYGQANLTALLMVLVFIAILARYRLERRIGGIKSRLYLDSSLFIVSGALFLTGSRGGLLALTVVILILVVLIRMQPDVFPARSFCRPLLILLIAYLAVTQVPNWWHHSPSAVTHASISIDARFLFWAASVLMFLDFPILGIGLDHFKLFLPSYAPQGHDLLGFVEYEAMGYTQWSHNELLQILAESGVVGFLLVCGFWFLLLCRMKGEVSQKQVDPDRIYLYLLLIAFFIMGMFSWPFRHPALLFIFFLVLGIVLHSSPVLSLRPFPKQKLIVIAFLAVSLLAVSYLGYKDHSFLDLKKAAMHNGCKFPGLLSAMDDDYFSFGMMRDILPLCVTEESFLSDPALLQKYLPYFKRIAELQGTHQQWYNLAIVYRALDKYELAKYAVQKCVERQPAFALGWTFLHDLNIDNAVRMTGRPKNEFLPPEKKLSASYYDLLFQHKQNIQSGSF